MAGSGRIPAIRATFYPGEKKQFRNTREAEESGVAIIYQELNLIPEMTVAENIFLDRQSTNSIGAIDWGKLNADTQALLDELGIKDFKPTDKVKSITVGKQQMVEIAKALSKRASILVLDEPTSALTEKEVADLFRIIRKLKQDGVCMCYISHKMEEIEQVADRIVVLRDGQTIGDVTPISEITLDQIIARMVGRDIKDMFPKREQKRGEKILEVKNLEVDNLDVPGEKKVRNASFSAYRGEILGICGLMGAGRTELVSGIFGAHPQATHGDVLGQCLQAGRSLVILLVHEGQQHARQTATTLSRSLRALPGPPSPRPGRRVSSASPGRTATSRLPDALGAEVVQARGRVGTPIRPLRAAGSGPSFGSVATPMRPRAAADALRTSHDSRSPSTVTRLGIVERE